LLRSYDRDHRGEGLGGGIEAGISEDRGGSGGRVGQRTLRVVASGLMLDWGVDESGELGNGTIAPYSDLPVAASGIQNAIAVSPGDSFVSGSRADAEAAEDQRRNCEILSNSGLP
jgi:hypothetical protein